MLSSYPTILKPPSPHSGSRVLSSSLIRHISSLSFQVVRYSPQGVPYLPCRSSLSCLLFCLSRHLPSFSLTISLPLFRPPRFRPPLLFPSLLPFPSAIKYSTAFPVIILSAVKYHVELEAWRGFYRPLWIAAAILNTCYSYYWDIARDWDFR